MIPVSLKIKNFFSHRDTDIDFSKFDSAILIGNVEGDYSISNGSGKSGIFESILWCLFNKSRTASMDDIIMWNENSCSVIFEFTNHGENYKVIRNRSRVTGTSDVELYIDDGGQWRDLSGSTAKLTNDEVIKVIRVDYKTFINSAYFRQNDISEFAESDAGRKKEILKSIIDISKWDEYESSVKDNIKEYKKECLILSEEIIDIDNIKGDLEDSKLKYDELNRLVISKGSNRVSLDSRIESLSDKYTTLKQNIDTDQWDKITEELVRLNDSIIILKNKKDSIAKELESYQFQINSSNTQISDAQRVLAELDTDPEADFKLNNLNIEKHKFTAEVTSHKERLVELDDIEITEGSCYVCGQSVSDELSHELHKSHSEKIDDLNKRVIFGNNRINQLNVDIAKLDRIIRNNKKSASLQNIISSSTSKLEMLKGHVTRLSDENKDLSVQIADVSDKIKSNEQVLLSLKNDDFNNLRVEIKKLKSDRVSVQYDLESINRDVGIYSQKIINLKEKILKMEASQEKLAEKKKQLSVFERFAKLLGKNGIQTILLNAVIEDLEETSNNILESICNESFQIILDTQRVGADGISIVDTLDLRVKKDGITQNFKSLSGGEQFRISLALRIALSEISSKHGGSSLDFLLLDEINSPLDRHGTENLFVNVIRSLETKYKILVITHDDLLKEKFDNIIDVTKINGESYVKFITK